MKKIVLIFCLVLFGSNYIVPEKANVNAGVIKWGAKKIISSFVKLIFSKAKDRVIEFNKEKLIQYLEKNPQYKEYAKSLILKQINKHPHLKERGVELLSKLSYS